MKISYSWLKQYINTDWSVYEIADKLTFSGLEVEDVIKTEAVPGGLEGVIVGEVVTCIDHPNSDHLHITEVNVGEQELLHIVCGAPNVAVGQKVAVATIGTTLYFCDPPLKIKKGKIRGEVSQGMICAEDELCLGKSHDGIMVLDDDAKVGTPLKEYLNLKDEYVLEIGLTANRSDAMGHLGVALDVAALMSLENYNNGNKTITKINLPDVSGFKPDNDNLKIDISIQDEKACLRYAGVSITGVKVQESPEWLKERLMSIGLKPINNIVDISNYVLFETGHPLHTFDADKISGNKIIIKKLDKGTKIKTLDEIERELSGDDLMICDDKEGLVIAGVLGGINSGISNDTVNVFIESALFDPTTIRTTAKRFGIQTDSSFRFERGVDPDSTIYALKRAALLIKEIAGGQISSDIIDAYPNIIEPKKVTVSFDRLNKLIGKEIPQETVLFILKSMDMQIISKNDNEFVVYVPSNKYDVTREADVIEEVLRIYGYNNIEQTSEHSFTVQPDSESNNENVQKRVSTFLTSIGFNEIMNNSLCSDELTNLVPSYKATNNVNIMNPLSKELNILRRDLLFGGLQSISHNIKRQHKNLKFYEFGQTYSYNSDVDITENVRKRYNEENHLSILMTGVNYLESWYKPSEEVTFYDIKAVVLRLISAAGIPLDKKTEDVVDDIFGETLIISINKKEVAKISIVPDNILNYFDIEQSVYYADILWDEVLKLSANTKISFTPIPRFPEVRRDLALLIDKSVKFSDILAIVKSRGGDLIKEVNLFDVYEGKNLGADKKSYAVSFLLRDDKKTLTDQQVDKVMNNLIKQFETNLKATLR